MAWKLLNENEEKALCWCRCDADLWRVLMWRKYQAALHHPGEAVGLLA